MPDGKPKFNPNKPFTPVSEQSDVSVQDKPKFDPSKPYKVSGEEQGFDVFQQFEPGKTSDQIIDSIQGIDDGKKGILKDFAKTGASKEQLSNSILTLQGKHPLQDGNSNYYINDKGEPIPLKPNEKPPAGYDIAKYWGTQKEADNDSFITSLGKHLYNGLIDAVEGQISSAETGTGPGTSAAMPKLQTYLWEELPKQLKAIGVPDEKIQEYKDKNYLTGLKNEVRKLKFETPSYEKESIFKTEGMKGVEDFFDPKRWNPTSGNIQGNILQGLESVVSFAIGRGGGLAKGAPAIAQRVLSGVSAYNMSLTPMLEVADEAGLPEGDKYAFATIAAIPQALIENMLGVGRVFTKNAIARAEIQNVARTAIQQIARNETGNITKEGLRTLYRDMSAASAKIAANYAKSTLRVAGEEAIEEPLQGLAEESSKMLYDKLAQDPKFKADAFSPEAMGKYANEMIGGFLGGLGGGAIHARQSFRIAQEKARSENVFATVQKGDEAVNNAKKNIIEQRNQGKITPQEAEDALIRLNSYKNYNDAITSRNLNMDENKKRELFDKTFEKENLESKLRTLGDPKKLNPIDQAEYHAIEKQANDLQKDINEIYLKAHVGNETTVGRKTIDDIASSDEKEKGNGKEEKTTKSEQLRLLEERFGTTEKKPDLRPIQEIPTEEFNKKGQNARLVHEKVADFLETQPDKLAVGTLVENPYEYNGKQNETFSVQLPDGKKIRFASSMTRLLGKGKEGITGGFRGHFQQEHFSDKTRQEMIGHPMAMRLIDIPAVGEKTKKGKTVKAIKAIKVIRPDTGRFIGWAKATNTGKNLDLSAEQEELLMQNESDEFPIDPNKYEGLQTQPTPVTPVPTKPTVDKNSLQKELDELYNKTRDKMSGVYNSFIQQGKTESEANELTQKQWLTTPEGKRANEIEQILSQPNEQINVERTNESQTTTRQESEPGNSEKAIEKAERKAKKLRAGTKKSKRKIRHPEKIRALQHEVFTPNAHVLQYFIAGGEINPESIKKLFKNATGELRARISYVRKGAPSVTELAHKLWESFNDVMPDNNFTDQDFVNEIEDVINSYTSSTQMAIALNEAMSEGENRMYNPVEEVMNEEAGIADSAGYGEQFDQYVSYLEELSDEELDRLANDQEAFNNWFDEQRSSGEQLQKQKANKGNVSEQHHQDVLRVAEHVQKVLPNINVVFDSKLQAAGKLSADGKTISINPYYAGLDTPIHEAGHVLIDSLGGIQNKTIANAISQLKATKLWKEISERYPELQGEMLGKEVLAEAIGREGANVFASETNKSRFRAFLEWFFNKVKQVFGLDKNIAKSLAKQIIGGVNTKDIQPTAAQEYFQIIGEKGAKMIEDVKNNFVVAEEMEKAGKTAEEIYAATGWERGVDNKWRYDFIENKNDFLMDEDFLFDTINSLETSENIAETTIGELFPNAKILEVYPEIANTKIIFHNEPRSKPILRGTLASYDGGQDKIYINGRQISDLADGKVRGVRPLGRSILVHQLNSSILHEIQHKIQIIEGFDYGGTARVSSVKDEYAKSVRQGIIDPNLMTDEQISDAMYNAISGEVEARNVEKRSQFSPEYRRKTPISKTEDTQRNKQLRVGNIGDYQAQEFNDFRRNQLGKDIEEYQNNLNLLNEIINDEDSTPEEISRAEALINKLENENLVDRAEFELYNDNVRQINRIAEAKDLEGFNLDQLIEAYNNAVDYEGSINHELRQEVMRRIAHYMNETQRELLRKNDKFVENEANKKDLSWKDVNFKVLSHMTQNFPELQNLSKIFDETYLDMQIERNEKKTKLEKLAKAVTKEVNAKLGIGERVKGFFISDASKYFDYLEEKGKIRQNTTGLSKAQIELLDYLKELVKDRQIQLDENGNYIQGEILRIDPTFAETFKTEGLMAAISNWMGGSELADVEVRFTDPATGRTESMPYLQAQKSLINYSNGGLGKKVIALAKMLQIAYKAKKSSGRDAYALNYNGVLTNKFDKPRNKDLGYSKDFYRAMQMYIDDYTHVKHMAKLVPVVNSLDYLYSNGYGEVLAKPNAKRWLQEWSQAQIYQTEKVTDPIIDKSLKFLRTLTSQLVMGFNIPANVMNVFIGNYNSFRAENGTLLANGAKRLFGEKGMRKKGVDILSKYSIVNLDIDSYPEFSIGKAFQRLAFAGQKYGEMQIQGTAFLGQLTEDEWNSFEYKNDELVVKPGVDEKKLKQQFIKYKNKVTDIQGKYSDKDRRNFARGEMGKNVQQFKTWIPDWWRVRFGSEYIDQYGNTVRGSWRGYLDSAFAELKNDIKTKGIAKGLWENKQAMQNLKGAMFVALMLVWKYSDDEDKKKRHKAISLDNMLGNLLFIFDTDQLKYTLKNPVASIGTVNKFIEVFEDVAKMDADEFMKDSKKVIPYNKSLTVVEDLIPE